MIDEKLATELKNKYNPEGSALRNLQLNLLDILIEFDKFAREHNIQYSLAYGTLLGAVRHQGFIPWDDDMDIMMSRDEWNKLQIFINDKGFITSNIFIKNFVRPELHIESKGLIDIFIIDNCPDNRLLAFVKVNFARFISLMMKCKNVVDTKFRGHKKIWWSLIPISLLFSHKQLVKMLHNICLWFNDDNDKDGCVYNACIKEMSDRIPLRLFREPMIKSKFEGVFLPCVSDYDTMLKVTYTNWQSLPKIPTNLGRVTGENVCHVR